MAKKKHLKGIDETEMDAINEKIKYDSEINYFSYDSTKLKTLGFKLNVKCKNEKQKRFLEHLLFRPL